MFSRLKPPKYVRSCVVTANFDTRLQFHKLMFFASVESTHFIAVWTQFILGRGLGGGGGVEAFC